MTLDLLPATQARTHLQRLHRYLTTDSIASISCLTRPTTSAPSDQAPDPRSLPTSTRRS